MGLQGWEVRVEKKGWEAGDEGGAGLALDTEEFRIFTLETHIMDNPQGKQHFHIGAFHLPNSLRSPRFPNSKSAKSLTPSLSVK